VPKAGFGTIKPQKRIFSATELSTDAACDQSHLTKKVVSFIEETEITVRS
jgi:hypothetical protein